MPYLLRRRGVEAKITTSARLIDSATAWWVPKLISGTTMTDQRGGGNDMVASGSVVSGNFTNDGTYNLVQLRSTSSQFFAASDAAVLDADAGDYTLVIVLTPQVNLTGTKILWAKREGAALGYNLSTTGTTPATTFDDDVAAPVSATGGALTVGTRATIAAVKSGTTLRFVKDGTAGTGQTVSTNSIANAVNPRINRGSGVTTAYSDQDFYGAAWFKGTALSDAQTVTVGSELLAATAL